MSEDLGVILIKINSENKEPMILNEDSIFKKFDFSLKNEEELLMVEEFLNQENNFTNFVCKFI